MNRRKRVNKEKIFSVVITFAIIATLVVGVVSVVRKGNATNEQRNLVDLNETQEDIYVEKETEELAKNDIEKKVVLPTEDVTEKLTEQNTTAIKEGEIAVVSPTGASAKYTFGENDILQWPVSGDILLKYSMDTTIFFPTLGVYKCNPAISIGASEDTNVAAAASGVVKTVTTSEETGTTVVVDIGNEYQLTYGLIKDITVKKGDTVVAGQYLGKVSAPTSYYSKEGSNLYFKMTKDGSPVDPTLFFPE